MFFNGRWAKVVQRSHGDGLQRLYVIDEQPTPLKPRKARAKQKVLVDDHPSSFKAVPAG